MEVPRKSLSLPADSGQSQRLAHEAEALLASAFEASGWRVTHRRSASTSPDLVCRKGDLAYAVEIKALAGRSRRAGLQALLADAILRARASAGASGAQPLAVLAVSSLSDGMAAELGEYVRAFGGSVAWGALDLRGRFELRGEGLDSIVAPGPPLIPDRRTGIDPGSGGRVRNPFSDLGQWALKVLIARNVPERWLVAPREPFRTISDLADASGVSLAGVSRLLSALEVEGYVTRVGRSVRVTRVNALLDAWRIAAQAPGNDVPARFLLPTRDPQKRLREVLAARHRVGGKPASSNGTAGRGMQAGPPGQRACLALFAACKELGVGHVNGAPLHLYAEDLSQEFLESLELHPVEHRSDADLTVRRPRFPESVFRGCVVVGDVPVSDIVQCWLDVSFHPARGAEQAAEILQRLNLPEWDR